MKPSLYNYRCGCCEFVFKSPELTETYGVFIMHSNKVDDSVYLHSFDDKVFNEVDNLFKENEIIKNTNRLNDSDFFQSVFSISCDLAKDGSQYQIDAFPGCPSCGSRNMASWSRTTPTEFVAKDILPVKHECWNKLTGEEKKYLFNEAVKAYLKKE